MYQLKDRLSQWIKKENIIYIYCLQETHFKWVKTQIKSEKMEDDMSTLIKRKLKQLYSFQTKQILEQGIFSGINRALHNNKGVSSPR